MAKSPFNIQDQYLNQSRKERIKVVVHMMSGDKLEGYIKSFDNFSVLLDSNGDILIYKHAISTIIPDKPILSHWLGALSCAALGFSEAAVRLPFVVAGAATIAWTTWFGMRRMGLAGGLAAGLLLAFAGIVVLFARRWGPVTTDTLPGDLLILLGAALWGATTLYVKRHLAGRAAPVQTLFYQLAFSAPILLAWSALQEDRLWTGLTPAVGVSLAYQCFVVAFASYLAWFELIDRYSVSLLSAFTFFTPVFGVLLSAALLPGEALGAATFLSLGLVCSGMVLVNRPPR